MSICDKQKILKDMEERLIVIQKMAENLRISVCELMMESVSECEEDNMSSKHKRDICDDCVYRGLAECSCDRDPSSYKEISEKWGWPIEVVKEKWGYHMGCASKTGTCPRYQDDETKIVYCKDCKYGKKLDESESEYGEVWGCLGDGVPSHDYDSFCVFGERKE